MGTIETSTKLDDCPFCGGKAVMTFLMVQMVE